MDRLTQLRGEAGSSRDSSLDTLSPSEAFVTATESSKYFSLSEVDSTFDITPIKDVSLASTAAPEKTTETDQLISDLSPIPKKNDLLDSYKFGKQIEAANILSGGVNIFDDNDNSYDGDELVIDDNVDIDEKSNSELKNTGLPFQKTEDTMESPLVDSESAIESKDTEVVLQIDGKNVNAITIGNGLYLYRKEGEEELAAVQIIDDDQQQPSFKFLKVRENAEGNLEVYEEIQIEVPKEVPAKEEKTIEKNASHVPIKNISKVSSDTTCNKVSDRSIKTHEEILPCASKSDSVTDLNIDPQTETKTEVNVNGKMVKYNETRKSPVIHSTPNKEGIPLTKTMVDLKLHPSRQLDKVKTIEVHTDSCKQKLSDTLPKNKDTANENKSPENISTDKISGSNEKIINTDAPESHLSDKVNSVVQEIHKIDKLSTDVVDPNVNAVASKTNLNDKVDIAGTIPFKPDKIIETKVNVVAKPEADRSHTPIERIEQDNKESETPDKYESNEGTSPEKAYPSKKVDVDSLSESKAESINTEISTKHNPVESTIDIRSNMLECDKSIGGPVVISKKNELDIADNTSQCENKSQMKDPKALQNVISKDPNIPKQQSTETTQIASKAKEHDLKESNSKSETITVLNQVDQVKKDVKITEILIVAGHNVTESPEIKKDVKVRAKEEVKPINNNHAAVPFGKWTEANRQDFLNKIKETNKINCPNTNQLKQANDLNRRDVLQKIDSQRQSINAIKHQEASGTTPKLNVKNETKSFASRSAINQDSKIPVKSETIALKVKPTTEKKIAKQESVKKLPKEQSTDVSSNVTAVKIESIQKTELNYQHLIDKTIEDMIIKAGPVKTSQDEPQQKDAKTNNEKDTISHSKSSFQPKEKEIKSTNLDAIEMKMNELHGIPFVERPPHELPKIYNHDIKTFSKIENPKATTNKLPNLLPFTSKHIEKPVKIGTLDVDSDDEIIEHEPITGDIAEAKKSMTSKHSKSSPVSATVTQSIRDPSKKESIITEKDFDKFARRNSFTYENCLTVNFEGNEPHNVIQTVIEKDIPVKKYSRNERLLAEAKVKSSHKQQKIHLNSQGKIQIASKLVPVNDDSFNKNCQSKFQIAYQSALTAKRQMESPITIIEDKPVKVVFMDANSEFVPSQLNVQGQDLSPAKKIPEPDTVTVSTCDSLDSEVLDAINDAKPQDDATHRKHQRKQVLTPVETPELELIEPSDLGLEMSPKKKRKIDDSRTDRNPKNVVPKKSYLLGRTIAPVEETPASDDVIKNPLKETIIHSNSIVTHNDTASAIDNLVKAAELLETQSENLNKSSNTVHSDNSQQSTPVKRGRGRPRKYPLPEGAVDKNKVSSPQKKPRLIDAKKMKYVSDTDDTSDEEVIFKKENWTMGKINENIVCPICSKLFRSENVVFKHVKHCSGPSPNRSDSDIRSTRRSRQSLESDTKSRESKSEDMDIDDKPNVTKDAFKKRKSRDIFSKSTSDKEDFIEIEPLKDKLEAQHGSRNVDFKTKTQRSTTNLACEICGKMFRQLSYLVSHKLQHKKDEPKKTNNDTQAMNKSLFSCEVCKKEFRKLHHLVQHRLIHNPSVVPSRSSRKSSSEQNDNKSAKNQDTSKLNEDQSAAFRCEPCDKSFRKLHHLVEHRETHDGKSRQKNNPAVVSAVEKPTPAPPPQCDVCKKTFRKLHHMIEHKEQHLDTCSEKSDDKSVKSSLSTRDIIHECSLCYMVFPNEHSLNKHSVICQRKKRQSAAKKTAQMEKNETEETEIVNAEDNEVEINQTHFVSEEKINMQDIEPLKEKIDPPCSNKIEEMAIIPDNSLINENDIESTKTKSLPKNEHIVEPDKPYVNNADIPDKIKKAEDDVIIIQDTPKKKVSVKDKVGSTVTKRQKDTNPPPLIVNMPKTAIETSDDDEIRYMFNPDFKSERSIEEKVFMTVKAKKRNSLQIERPKSKDSVNRRTSLQHPPKVPRLKPKAIQVTKTAAKTPGTLRNDVKTGKSESVPSTDSDDSDVKYSFPKTHVDKTFKSVTDTKSKEIEKRTKEKRKSLAEKRKSLTTIAKRKSLVKISTSKPKHVPPVKPVKRRNTEVEHRCDCGQLFSSGALLSRHTTLAHTPPRIRRRRSPPPDIAKSKIPKLAPQRPSDAEKVKPSESRKSSVKTDTGSSFAKTTGMTSTTRSMIKDKGVSVNSAATAKVRRNAKQTLPHRGESRPEKMKKKSMTETSKK